MPRWSKIYSAMAIASPLLISLLVCAVFVFRFALSSVHAVEVGAVAEQTRTLSVVGSYLEHLVEDMLANIEDLNTSLANTHTPTRADLVAFQANMQSPSHVRALAIVDAGGQVIEQRGMLAGDVLAMIPGVMQRMGGGVHAIYLPHACADPDSLPGFVLAAPLHKGGAVAVLVDVSAQTSRPAIKLADINGSFALMDVASTLSAPVGGSNALKDWRTEARDNLEAAPPANDGSVREHCTSELLTGGHCFVFRQLANSSLVLAGMLDNHALRAQWVKLNRPIWIFALLVVAGATASSLCNGLWLRARRRDRSQVAVAPNGAERAFAAKSNFLAHMSHELRTPLNSIIGFSELIRQAYFGPLNERYRAYADDINFSAKHLQKLASDMMEVDRIERGNDSAAVGTADLNTIAADAARMLSVLAKERGIRIAVTPKAEPAVVGIEPHRGAQVGVNLVSNAVKYSEPGDEVVISVEQRPDGGFALVVMDEGVGMTPAEIAYTAQSFGQPADRRSGRHDSVGLGLPIVRGLLAAVGGHLTIDSEKNRGTTVCAIFPALRCDSAAASAQKSHVG